jgi:hypothetical protein
MQHAEFLGDSVHNRELQPQLASTSADFGCDRFAIMLSIRLIGDFSVGLLQCSVTAL